MTYKEWCDKWSKVSFMQITDDEFREYIEDCFNMYETEGFHTDRFNAQYKRDLPYKDKPFEVVRRCTEGDVILFELLPAWDIKFEDGTTIIAYPEEICNINPIG